MLVELLFIVGNLAVAPFWLLMIALPRWSWTRRLIESPLILVPPALCYLLVLVMGLPSQFTFDLNGVAALLGTPVGAAAAWLHLLTFDLFVGRWIYLERRSRAASPLVTSVILLFVLLTGPFGFLLSLLVSRLQPRATAPDKVN